MFILLGTILCHKGLREEVTESVVIHVKMWLIELALLFAAEIFIGRDKISNEQTCKKNKTSVKKTSHLVPTVLLETVQESTGICQPEGSHLKVIIVFLENEYKQT